jgi:hypothetical protein
VATFGLSWSLDWLQRAYVRSSTLWDSSDLSDSVDYTLGARKEQVRTMINTKEIKNIARARLQDAEVLVASRRYEGAIYLCGYAVELGLKARICKTLKWSGFPSTRKELEGYHSFKTHNLDVLLHLTGMEDRIKTRLFAEWSAVAEWDPESRYNPIGNASPTDANLMVSAAKSLLARL